MRSSITAKPPEQRLTMGQAAVMIGRSQRSVRRLVRRGLITHETHGHRTKLIPMSAVSEYLRMVTK